MINIHHTKKLGNTWWLAWWSSSGSFIYATNVSIVNSTWPLLECRDGYQARVNQHPWCTNVDGWCTHGCTFSSLPVPGLTKVVNSSWPFFIFLSSAQVGFFWGELFFSSPLTPAQVSPTHPSTYLPINLCTYALNLHQGNDDVGQWRYCNILGRLLRSPSYLPPC